MNAPPDPQENTPDPSTPPTPTPFAEFQKAIEDWSQSDGKDNVEQQEAIALRLLTLAAEHASTKPSPDDEWHKRIAATEDAFEWDKSIALRREHIEWKRANDPHRTWWKNMTDLARLLWMCGQRTEAAAIAEKAVLCARESGLSFAPLMTTPMAARFAAALGRVEEAERWVEEALAGAEAAPDRTDGIRGRLTLPLRFCRAQLALGRGDLLLAQRQLDDIWPEIASSAESPILAGLRSRHAEHADITGQLHFARGESAAAIEAFERAIHHQQAVLGMPQIGESPYVKYAMAGTQLRLADALAPTQPEAAHALRRQAMETFQSLHVPSAPPH